MAIFTSEADRGLPALTWAAQVDTEASEEMAAFIMAFTEWSRHPAHYAHWRQRLAQVIEEGRQQQASSSLLDIETGVYLRMTCKLSRAILGEIADHGSIKRSSLRDMMELMAALTPPFAIPASMPGEMEADADERLPADSIYFATRSISKSPGDDLALRILRELQGVFPSKVRLVARCLECDSPFVRHAQRKEQRYCSHRCADRVSTRRRRASIASLTSMPVLVLPLLPLFQTERALIASNFARPLFVLQTQQMLAFITFLLLIGLLSIFCGGYSNIWYLLLRQLAGLQKKLCRIDRIRRKMLS